ncbi:MAG: PRC-barrel domain-containing protein [Syntrophomonadaceae bacterium]|nr:PRC-barrel domain-containing protein [Syntrophomonadaceae bacterium]
MKCSAEIVGLPIISIIKGREVGTVRELLINPHQGEVAYLLLNTGPWYTAPCVLPFKEVFGIGEYAVTIEYDNSISLLENEPEVKQLLESQVKVIGTRVITRTGKCLGRVGEIQIDEDSGKISACLMEPADGSGTVVIPASSIITFGQEVLVIKEEAAAPEKQATTSDIKTGEPPAAAAESSTAAAPLPKTHQLNGANGVQLFEERQRQSVLGKKLVRPLLGDNGEVLAGEGETVTAELLEKAMGLGKFLDLTTAVER